MKKDTHTTEVVFRMFNDEVIALFPYSIYNHTGTIDSYMHIGQHSESDYNHCIKATKPATKKEYIELKKELSSIGYNLKVIKRRNYDKYLSSFDLPAIIFAR